MKYFLCLLCVQLVVFFATSSDLSIDIDALLSSNDIISSPTLSKEVIIEGLTKLVEPFASSYPYGIQYPREVQIGEDGHAVISSSSETDTDHRSLAGIDPSQLAKLIAFLTTHEGLSAGCSNKLCSYFEYALSCKAIGFNLKKVIDFINNW